MATSKRNLALLVLLVSIIFVAGCTNSQPPSSGQNQRVASQPQQQSCQPNWLCTDWSVCQRTGINTGIQNRTCFDNSHCNITINKPSKSQPCSLTWLDYAFETNQTKSLGNFKVTLERIGFYSYKPYSWSDEKLYFRADVRVENIGHEAETLNTYDAVLVQDKNQYDRSFYSELDTSGLRPGVIREGYLLFENVPVDIFGTVRIDVGSSYWTSIDYLSYKNYLYSFNVNLTNLVS